MDSLVRMRYLFDTLQLGEQQEAIKRITTTCGPQMIMTLIFNHFAERLHSKTEDQSMTASIIEDISSVITDRETEAQTDHIESSMDIASDTEDEPISIEDFPSVLTSKIASYLNQRDYLHFMHLSRSILIGCHSPFSLYHLNVYDRKQYSSARGFRPIVSRSITTRFSKLNHGGFDAIEAATPLLSNSNIKRLSIIHESGDKLCQRGVFRRFLRNLPHIECIEIPSNIWIYRGTVPNWELPTMPALKGSDYHFGNNFFYRLQRALIQKHAMQIESLKLGPDTPGTGFERGSKLPEFALFNLTELKIGQIRGTLSHQALCEWIKQSSKLKMFSIDCSRVHSLSKLITFLIENQPDLHFTEFVCDAVKGNVMESMQQIGNGLSISNLKEATKMNEDKEFKVRIRCKGGWMDRKEQSETATNILMEILRGHDHLTIEQLNREFDASQPVSWEIAFQDDLCDLQSFVRNHARFRIVPRGLSFSKSKCDKVEIEGASSSERELNATLNIDRLQKAQKIIDGVGYLLQILEGCNVRHFMVQIVLRLRGCMRTSKQQQVEGMEGAIDDLVQKWKEEYRVDTFYESKGKLLDDRWRITFCNKDNPMEGGYGANGLFIE